MSHTVALGVMLLHYHEHGHCSSVDPKYNKCKNSESSPQQMKSGGVNCRFYRLLHKFITLKLFPWLDILCKNNNYISINCDQNELIKGDNRVKQYISLTLLITRHGEEKTGQAQAEA